MTSTLIAKHQGRGRVYLKKRKKKKSPVDIVWKMEGKEAKRLFKSNL